MQACGGPAPLRALLLEKAQKRGTMWPSTTRVSSTGWGAAERPRWSPLSKAGR